MESDKLPTEVETLSEIEDVAELAAQPGAAARASKQAAARGARVL